MAVGIRPVGGRLSAAKPFVCSAAKCVPLRRRGCDAFGRFAHGMGVACLAGCDSLARKRPAKRTKAWMDSPSTGVDTCGWIRPSTAALWVDKSIHPESVTYKWGWINSSAGSCSTVQVGPPPRRPLNFQFEVGKTKAPVKNARERTQPVIGMGNAANAKKG